MMQHRQSLKTQLITSKA